MVTLEATRYTTGMQNWLFSLLVTSRILVRVHGKAATATWTAQDLVCGEWSLLVSTFQIPFCYPEARKCFVKPFSGVFCVWILFFILLPYTLKDIS